MNFEDYVFDYRLGYIREGHGMEGFDLIGADSPVAGSIVTLGGYTTPEQARGRSTWADGLYRALDGTYQILNGCTEGYASAQILTLFMREVILLAPKLVICLSGFHDFAYKLGFVENKDDAAILKSHPFATPGQMAFFRKITPRFGLGKDEVYYGEDNHLPAWQCWLWHMDMIKCLCEEFGMAFLSFLQPCIFSGLYERTAREQMELEARYGLTADEIHMMQGLFQEQYAGILRETAGRDYIVDLSGIFDGEKDVYLDAVHVRDGHVPKMAGAIKYSIHDRGAL